MQARITTLILLAGLILSAAGVMLVAKDIRFPNEQKGYEPEQPIAYSHRVHAGDLEIPCLYCHYGAEESRNAGVPPLGICMNCHRFVTASFGAIREEDKLAAKEKRKPERIVSPEIRKIYDHLGLDGNLKQVKAPVPVQWVRVHNLPDFATFDHRPHVASGVACQTCHGPAETMDRMRQESPLSMGWCVNCHRQSNKDGVNGKPVKASLDCSVCHF